MTTTTRDHWQSVYSTKSADSVSWFQERPETSLDLITRGGLAHDARIVDVGGGASTLVDVLLDAGYGDVTVLDIAPAALDQARLRLAARSDHVHWVAADVTEWRPAAAFDVWHDRAVFHFLTEPAARAAYRATLEAALKPGGRVVIGTFGPDGPQKCSGLPVVRYSAESLAAELGEAFRLIDSRMEPHHTPTGAVQHFQFSLLHRL